MQRKDIILKSIVTEKSNLLVDRLNKYSFYVAKDASKLQVRKAIEHLYAVDVLSVSTARLGGGKKIKKYTNKGVLYISKSIQKKAIVTLKDGQTIDFSKEKN